MKRLFALLATMGACALFAQEELFRPQKIEWGEKPVTFELNERTGLLLAKTEFAGKPCTFLVDTGATHTSWNLSFMQEKHPEIALRQVTNVGQSNVDAALHVFVVPSLKVGDTTFRQFLGIAVPLDHLSKTMGTEVDGILGMSVMGRRPFRFSAKDRTLTWQAEATPPEGAVALDVKKDLADNCIHLNARVDGSSQTFTALIDSGANMTSMDSKVWPDSGASTTIETTNVNTMNSAQTFKTGATRTLVLGDFKTPIANPVLKDIPDSIAILGIGTLRNFDLFLDGAGKQAWAIPHATKADAPTSQP